MIPLSNPDITTDERELVMEVLRGPSLSLGPKLPEFEQKVADYVGSRFAVAVNSGTSGLHLCVKALGVKPHDEIITTPFSFVASANCMLYEQAIPVFVDIDPTSLNIDVEKIERKIGPRTRGILPVHVFGQPCAMDEILEIAKRRHLLVIEDACEALGAEYQLMENGDSIYRKVGSLGDCGVFAFYPNKQITTGEGGVIVTNNEAIARLCRSLRNQGRSENGKWLYHERLGYNYRLSDINCALGLAQMARIEEILKKREKVARWYVERLSKNETIVLPQIIPGRKISWFVFVIRLQDDFTEADRQQVLEKLLEQRIGCNCYFSPIHLQPFYQSMFGYQKGDFPITEKVAERTIALPFFSNMSEAQVDCVCDRLTKILEKMTIRRREPYRCR